MSENKLDSVVFKEIETAFDALQELVVVSENIKNTASFSIGMDDINDRRIDTYYPNSAEVIKKELTELVRNDSLPHLEVLSKYGFKFGHKFD